MILPNAHSSLVIYAFKFLVWSCVVEHGYVVQIFFLKTRRETTSTSLVGRRVSLTGFISLVSSSSCSLISAKCWNPNRENIYQ